MPWSSKQHRLFEAAAHSPAVARRVGIPQADASRMAGEGIKKATGGSMRRFADGGTTGGALVGGQGRALDYSGLGALSQAYQPTQYQQQPVAQQPYLNDPAIYKQWEGHPTPHAIDPRVYGYGTYPGQTAPDPAFPNNPIDPIPSYQPPSTHYGMDHQSWMTSPVTKPQITDLLPNGDTSPLKKDVPTTTIGLPTGNGTVIGAGQGINGGQSQATLPNGTASPLKPSAPTGSIGLPTGNGTVIGASPSTIKPVDLPSPTYTQSAVDSFKAAPAAQRNAAINQFISQYSQDPVELAHAMTLYGLTKSDLNNAGISNDTISSYMNWANPTFASQGYGTKGVDATAFNDAINAPSAYDYISNLGQKRGGVIKFAQGGLAQLMTQQLMQQGQQRMAQNAPAN